MELTQATQIYMQKYNVTFQDVLFCHLLAAGADPGEAHNTIYNKNKKTTSADQEKKQATETLKLNPGMALLIQEIKRKQFKQTAVQTAANLQDRELTDEEKEKFTTRKGLIEEMIKDLPVIPGKDRVNILQSLAKIQGLDKPDEGSEEERRVFVLRWLSHCRTCKLMREFLSIKADFT